MRYIQSDDDEVIKNSVDYLTKINQADRRRLGWLLDDFKATEITLELLVTPQDFSNKSKLEFLVAKKAFLDSLKYGPVAIITNPEWAERNRPYIFKKYGSEAYSQPIISFKETREHLVKRTKLRLRIRKHSAEGLKKKTSTRKRLAAKKNSAKSAKIRSQKAEELTHKIFHEALQLFGEIPKHNITAILEKKFPLSGRQIRRHLSKTDFYHLRMVGSNYLKKPRSV